MDEGRSYRDAGGGSGTTSFNQQWEGSVARLEVRPNASVEVLKLDALFFTVVVRPCIRSHPLSFGDVAMIAAPDRAL